MAFDLREVQAQSKQQYIEKLMGIYDERRILLRGRKIDFLTSGKNSSYCDVTDKTYSPAEVTAFFVGVHFSGLSASGAMIGAAVGIPGGPPTMAIGAGIGAGIGALVGLGTGSALAAYKLQEQYESFKKTEAGKEFGKDLQIFIQSQDGVFDEICCNISYEPVVDGVITPDGKLYERKILVAHIEKYGSNPGTGEKLSIKDLRDASELNFESLKNYLKFLKEKREITAEKAPHLLVGYDSLIKTIRGRFIESYDQEMNYLKELLSGNQITFEEFSQKSLAAVNKFLSVGNP